MKARPYGWILVALLWVVALLNYTDRQVVFSLFPLLSSQFNLSGVQLGLLSTVFLWVYGTLSPGSGYLADRFGRGRLITVSLMVWSAVTLATALLRRLRNCSAPAPSWALARRATFRLRSPRSRKATATAPALWRLASTRAASLSGWL
jgi:MFS family permease